MTVAAKKLAEQALALPEDDRLKLYRLLGDSLSHEDGAVSQKEWDAAWKKELKRRISEIEDGSVKCVPYKAVRKEMDAILGKS